MTNRDLHIVLERPLQKWPEVKLRDGPVGPKGGEYGEASNSRLSVGLA
jgi:hypothetical protein